MGELFKVELNVKMVLLVAIQRLEEQDYFIPFVKERLLGQK
ncbi:MAG: hypothetical protein ABI342_09005 [Nitrososphaera sp.]